MGATGKKLKASAPAAAIAIVKSEVATGFRINNSETTIDSWG
jgi:hypothetical protein